MKGQTIAIMAIFVIMIFAAGCSIINYVTYPDIVSKCRSSSDVQVCYSDEGIARQDTAVCDRLIDNPKSAGYCYYSIAEDKNDSSYCPKIKDEYWADVCYKHFADINVDVNQCKGIKNSDYRQECIYNIAIKTNNYEVCDDLGQLKMFECLTNIAKELGNVSICKGVASSSYKPQCVFQIAYKLKDTSICSEMQSNFYKERCINQLKEALNLTQ